MLSVENKPFILSIDRLKVVMLSVENKTFMLNADVLNVVFTECRK